mgnify:FL=1
MNPTRPNTISFKIKRAVEDGYAYPREIAKHLGLSLNQVTSVLTSLVVHEQVSRVGSTTEDYRYFSLKKELMQPLLSQRWSGDFSADWVSL